MIADKLRQLRNWWRRERIKEIERDIRSLQDQIDSDKEAITILKSKRILMHFGIE